MNYPPGFEPVKPSETRQGRIAIAATQAKEYIAAHPGCNKQEIWEAVHASTASLEMLQRVGAIHSVRERPVAGQIGRELWYITERAIT